MLLIFYALLGPCHAIGLTVGTNSQSEHNSYNSKGILSIAIVVVVVVVVTQNYTKCRLQMDTIGHNRQWFVYELRGTTEHFCANCNKFYILSVFWAGFCCTVSVYYRRGSWVPIK